MKDSHKRSQIQNSSSNITEIQDPLPSTWALAGGPCLKDELDIYAMNMDAKKLKDWMEGSVEIPVTFTPQSLASLPGNPPYVDGITSFITRDGFKFWQCKTCTRLFATRCHILEHWNCHLSIKPHICLHCSAAFSHKVAWAKHIKNDCEQLKKLIIVKKPKNVFVREKQ